MGTCLLSTTDNAGKGAIMATTLAYIASLCTRKYTSSANAKNDVACQEFYDSSYNYVGIISFPGLNLVNKVITEIWLDIDAEKAGYGVKNTKTGGRPTTRMILPPASQADNMLGMNWAPLRGPSTETITAIISPGRCLTPWRHTSLPGTTASPFITP